MGYKIDKNGLTPLKKKIDAIKNLPVPKKQKELLHYLGAINYFRASLSPLPPEAEGGGKRFPAEILMPLYSLPTCEIAKKTTFEEIWKNSPKIIKAYEDSKKLLEHSINLNFPDPQAPLALTCDASKVALGGVLEQLEGGGEVSCSAFLTGAPGITSASR